MPRPRLVLPAVLAVAAVLAVPAFAADVKPRGTYELSFSGEPGGKLKVAKLKLARLTLQLPADDAKQCDIPKTATVGLAAKPKLRLFDGQGGRYAYAKLNADGLFVPKVIIFKIGGASVGGRLELLWDATGKTLTTGRATIGDCDVSFSGKRAS
jgi:hypothetical protein